MTIFGGDEMNDDDELLAEIAAQADRAVENAPRLMDLKALATVLAQKFGHRTVEDIEEQLVTVWRARGLFWRT
jgi:hypothetical protein